MPRGKYVNHKGRSRHFTSPEELQQESSDEDTTTSEEDNEEGNDGAVGIGAGSSKVKTKKSRDKKSERISDNESDEESSEDDRDARKGVASLIEIENPNRAVKKAVKKVGQISLDDVKKQEMKPELSRREREQIEKEKERLRYEKMHAAGKTDEARADLARLAIIRQQRAEAAAKREAEKKALDEKKSTTKA